MTQRLIDFAHARHQVWEARQLGLPQDSWTPDAILKTRKFTNTFRILDPGTQFVITDLLDPWLEDADQFARLFLYRHTGNPEAWRALHGALGTYPTLDTLEQSLKFWRDYTAPVFTTAYIVRPPTPGKGTKLPGVIQLTRLATQMVAGIWSDRTSTQSNLFYSLRAVHGVGDFMAFQILTDWGYAGVCQEDQFVVAGPGARKGAALLGAPAEKLCADLVARRVGPVLEMPNGQEHRLTLADWQNCLCELFKYDRYQRAGVHNFPAPLYHTTTETVPPVFPDRW
jgi:hypothetical protein